jgi:hypothetical protein
MLLFSRLLANAPSYDNSAPTPKELIQLLSRFVFLFMCNEIVSHYRKMLHNGVTATLPTIGV